MHTLNFKDHGVALHNSFGQTLPSPFVPWWSALGSQPNDRESPGLEKNSFTEQPKRNNQFILSPKLGTTIVVPGKGDNEAINFSATAGQTKDSADKHRGPTSISLQSSLQKSMSDVGIGLRQLTVSANYPCMDQCYGLYAVYGTQQSTGGRMLLPLNVQDYGPIYVNAKQYHGILRRRQYRAKVAQRKKITREKKPYLHESRHLHAMRRARGVGGRFLNTKNVDDGKTATLKDKSDSHINLADHSPSSEVLDSNSGNRNSGKEITSFGSTNSGSEVTSVYSHGDFNNYQVEHLRPAFRSFTGDKWTTAADGCCDFLKV